MCLYAGFHSGTGSCSSPKITWMGYFAPVLSELLAAPSAAIEWVKCTGVSSNAQSKNKCATRRCCCRAHSVVGMHRLV